MSFLLAVAAALAVCGVGEMCPPGRYNAEAAGLVVANDRSMLVVGVSGKAVSALGEASAGGAMPPQLVDGGDDEAVVVKHASTERGFAVVTSSNRTLSWGDPGYGGGAMPANASGDDVRDLCATSRAFAVLKGDGSVVSWGDVDYGGDGVPALVPSLRYVQIAAGERGFAALDSEGQPHVWGHPRCGGRAVPRLGLNAVAPPHRLQTALAWADAYCDRVVATAAVTLGEATATFTEEVIALGGGALATEHSTDAFASLTVTGRVVAWGDASRGGGGPRHDDRVGSSEAVVVQLSSTRGAFAARTSAGRVFCWGATESGGVAPVTVATGAQLIVSNDGAFAVITADHQVITWGDRACGGERRFAVGPSARVVATDCAFGIALANGTVLTAGSEAHGGEAVWWLSGVESLYAGGDSFAAVKRGGEVVTWGGGGEGYSASSARCADCPAGKRGPGFMAVRCEDCGERRWSVRGDVDCRSCPVGVCDTVHLSIALVCCVLFMTVLVALAYASPYHLVDGQDDDDDGISRH